MSELAKLFIVTGALLLCLGGLLLLGGKTGWLFRSPGDIWIERGNFRFVFPLTTCILLSVFLSFLFWMFRR